MEKEELIQVTVKNVKKQVETFSLPKDSLVSALVKRVTDSETFHDYEFPKLVYKGKTLSEDVSLKDANVTDGGELIVMKQRRQDLAKPSIQSQLRKPVRPGPPGKAKVEDGGEATEGTAVGTMDFSSLPDGEALLTHVMSMGYEKVDAEAVLVKHNGVLGAAIAELAEKDAMTNAKHALTFELNTGGEDGVLHDQAARTLQMLAEATRGVRNGNDMQADVLAEALAKLSLARSEQSGQEVVAAIKEELTQADVAAIRRLMELGFSEGECIEAFIACGKNEQYAANFLFEN